VRWACVSEATGAQEEATLSRIFAGVHLRFDLTVGQELGGAIADFVTRRVLT
jgi:hypothetical protein